MPTHLKPPIRLLSRVGNTPLHLAALHGHLEVAEILLDFLSDAQVNVSKMGQALASAEKAAEKAGGAISRNAS